jgi:AcrR family transcriptional regulator
LDAALTHFSLNGYDATGVAEICRSAKLSKGAFYHHFPSKQAVFLELIDRWLAELDEQMAEARHGAETTSEALLQMAGMVGHVFASASGHLPMFLEFLDKAMHDPAIWEATNMPYRRYRNFFARMIDDGIAAGTLRPADSELVAQILVSLAVGLVLQGLLDPHGADWGLVACEGVRMLLGGLQTEEHI